MQQTFTGAIAAEIKPSPNYPATPTIYIVEIHISFSVHPTTSEEITASLKGDPETSFSHLLFKDDPSGTDPDGNDITEIRWSFSERYPLIPGEKIKVEYPNTDGNTVDVTFIHRYS